MLNSQAISTAEKMAKEKLERIIEREGDANGERRKPDYFMQLFTEAIHILAVEREIGIEAARQEVAANV